MKFRIVFKGNWILFIALLNLFSLSMIFAQITTPADPPEWLKPWEAPIVPYDYRSPGEPHKLIIERSGDEHAVSIEKIRPLNVYNYHLRKLYLLTTKDLNRLSQDDLEKMKIRDDYNLIRLRDRYFDTTIPEIKTPAELNRIPAKQRGYYQIPIPLKLRPQKEKTQLHLVQFVGPAQNDWMKDLRQIEGLQIVCYIPENAYLVWADNKARESVGELFNLKPYVQWHGPFHPAYKLHPAFDLEYSGDVTATVQLVTHEKLSHSITVIKNKASDVLRDTYSVGQYTNILVKLPAAELVNITKLEDVVNVEPWIEPERLGERQGQIVAGNLNAAGDGPLGPGYLAWLNTLGFNSNFDFTVDVTDDGFDQGQTGAANVHEDFLDGVGTSRITYVRRISGTTVTTANDENCGGHGTINASIVGGRNETPATDPNIDYYMDGDGYHFGLGVAPYALLGSSKIFNTFYLYPDLTTIIDRAYSDGARISSNSWGTPGNGSYSADSQEYDTLVRDGRPSSAPSGGESGNQEMVIIFAAGNEGPNARTLREGGPSAKNTVTIGASENLNDTGDADGCNPGGCCDDNDADDIRDVADFSGRGPCDGVNGRVKPDIMAPGTHVFGAASQDACFDGSSVCGDTDNNFTGSPDDAYYPDDPDATDTRDQDLYTWSSGTSHSCPAVSGGAALLRQWFLDHGHPAPSPAMTKAFLMNSATYMTGTGANDDLPSNSQGMGRMNLGMAFDNTPRILFDQVKTCYRSGAVDATEIFAVDGQVADNTLPFRVTLVWTDAAATPGAGAMLNNDLDMEVQIGGNFYRGNDFTDATSNIGAIADAPDDINNVESVYLAAGVTGNFTVTVRPADINSDGVVPSGGVNRQDFALVIYNAEFPARNPVDIILVLDRSGSMNSIAPGGTDSKIELLKDAVEMFIRSWEPFSIPGDRMGIVYFNNGITKYPNAATVLIPFQTNADTLINNVRAISATNCTALGGGILTAMRGFDGVTGHQKHIVVFTNGMQNCSPMVTDVAGAHQILDDPFPTCCNSSVPDEPGVNIANYDVKAIHTIGTGALGATWRTLISNIASETGGTNHFTDEPDEDLEDYFLETLVTILRVDPVEKVKTVSGTIQKDAPSQQEFFNINSTVRKATFALSWRGERRNDALTFSLIDPDGNTIPTGLQTIEKGLFYCIASLDFPLDMHGNRINHSGNWRLVINSQLEVSQVSYRVHLIVDDADVRYQFNLPTADYGVGEMIPISFWMQHGNRTITNLSGEEITATIARPPIGFGTFMVKHPVSKNILDQPIDLSGDMFPNLAVKKGYILTQDRILRKELEQKIDRITLYDDGDPQHGDMKANDGVYSAFYENTERPGYYNIDLTVKGNEPELGSIHRSESKTFSVGLKNFDLAKSSFDINKVKTIEGKLAYEVSVLPIDHYDNYLGPGHTVKVIIAKPGKKWGPEGRRVKLTDNLDGSYSGKIELTEEEIKAGAELVIDVNGVRVTTLQQQPGKWSVSFHSGAAMPRSVFADTYDTGVNYILDASYWFNQSWALVGFAGYNDFISKITGVDDNKVWNLSLNLRHYNKLSTMPGNAWSYYMGGGFGVYIPDAGNTELGLNIGVGVNRVVSSTVTAEVGMDYHKTFDTIEFIHSHIGVVFRF